MFLKKNKEWKHISTQTCSSPKIKNAIYKPDFWPKECERLLTGICPVAGYNGEDPITEDSPGCLQFMKEIYEGVYENHLDPIIITYDLTTNSVVFADGRHRTCVYSKMKDREKCKLKTIIHVGKSYKKFPDMRIGDFTID